MRKPAKKISRKYKLKALLTNYLFILPALTLFVVLSIYPFLSMVRLSFFSWSGIGIAKKFVGLWNYKDIIFSNPIWWKSLGQAGYITLLALTVQNGLALILALACDRDIKGGKFYRVVFYLPPVLSGIVVGLIWTWIFDKHGLLNHFMSLVGFSEIIRPWLARPESALTAVAIVHMWKGFGWGFVIMLAGLQSIPRPLYEAARVDGANLWHTFRKITFPLMIPVFVVVLILTILGTMQIYDIIVATTGGGPGYHTEVPITRIISNILNNQRFGYACSQGIFFGLILLFFSLIQIKISRKFKPHF
ncbi:MAG: sugar ABC transporter permease [Candidatus Ratteibacteria bacterium]|nr:sugar ABC transporter permease [Candidatus Ratteibacteria bacterium]